MSNNLCRHHQLHKDEVTHQSNLYREKKKTRIIMDVFYALTSFSVSGNEPNTRRRL
jgi:hypothetical protein